jgi:hypothetical protein
VRIGEIVSCAAGIPKYLMGCQARAELTGKRMIRWCGSGWASEGSVGTGAEYSARRRPRRVKGKGTRTDVLAGGTGAGLPGGRSRRFARLPSPCWLGRQPLLDPVYLDFLGRFYK